jgi:predicted dehydrogenase
MSDQKVEPQLSSASRRDFLKASTAAAVSGTIAGSLAVERSAHAAGRDELKIGLVGCGGRGTGAARDALEAKPYVKLVAMGDAFEDSLQGSLRSLRGLKDFAERVDVPADRQFTGFGAYEKVIGAGVDLVILATPPGFRPIHFKAAVAAGKHVFMEKPVAVDAPGVRTVLEANKIAKEKSLGVGVGLQRHHQPSYLETIKRLHDGMIGDIIAARAYWNGGGVWDPRKTHEECKSEMEYQMRNWYYYNWLCGDHICEQHIHNLDVINWVKQGYPVKCNGMGGREVRTDKKYGEIYDHHYVEFEYADGSRMYSQCRHIPGCWNSVTEHVHGTKGTADISGHTIRVKGGETWRYRGPNPNPYVVEHQDLYTSIYEGKPLNEGDYGAYSTLTAVMGRMATYSGKEVTWEAALNSKISLAPKTYAWDAEPPTMPNASGEYAIAVPGQTQAV